MSLSFFSGSQRERRIGLYSVNIAQTSTKFQCELDIDYYSKLSSMRIIDRFGGRIPEYPLKLAVPKVSIKH